jgi:hypothetical protein
LPVVSEDITIHSIVIQDVGDCIPIEHSDLLFDPCQKHLQIFFLEIEFWLESLNCAVERLEATWSCIILGPVVNFPGDQSKRCWDCRIRLRRSIVIGSSNQRFNKTSVVRVRKWNVLLLCCHFCEQSLLASCDGWNFELIKRYFNSLTIVLALFGRCCIFYSLLNFLVNFTCLLFGSLMPFVRLLFDRMLRWVIGALDAYSLAFQSFNALDFF